MKGPPHLLNLQLLMPASHLMQCGIDEGPAAAVLHPVSHRMSYPGPVSSRAHRIVEAAKTGQVSGFVGGPGPRPADGAEGCAVMGRGLSLRPSNKKKRSQQSAKLTGGPNEERVMRPPHPSNLPHPDLACAMYTQVWASRGAWASVQEEQLAAALKPWPRGAAGGAGAGGAGAGTRGLPQLRPGTLPARKAPAATAPGPKGQGPYAQAQQQTQALADTPLREEGVVGGTGSAEAHERPICATPVSGCDGVRLVEKGGA